MLLQPQIFIPPISFLYRKEVYEKVGGYSEALPVLGDWDSNLTFLLNSDIAVIPKSLTNYHHRMQNVVNKGYSNTVVDGTNKHRQYDVILRNYLLREDIKNNKLGLRYVVNIERDHQKLSNTLNNLNLMEGMLSAMTKDMVRAIKKHGFWVVRKVFIRK